jgi:hypothetical protein
MYMLVGTLKIIFLTGFEFTLYLLCCSRRLACLSAITHLTRLVLYQLIQHHSWADFQTNHEIMEEKGLLKILLYVDPLASASVVFAGALWRVAHPEASSQTSDIKRNDFHLWGKN